MKKFVKRFLKWSLVSVAIATIIFVASFVILYLTSDKVPFDKEKLTEYSSKIEFFDSQNKPLKEKNTFNNKYVKISNLPQYVLDAFISIEDKEFYNHNGLNYKRIAKALILDIKNRNLAQGASTISQQLIKNTHLSSQKTFSRKFNEIILTKQLEKNFTKDQILENYLNIIYFGNNCYGIENASDFYFSKPAKQLNLQESAMLAGLISSPARYSPINNMDKCTKRRNVVLNEMKNDNKITLSQYNQAINTPISLNITPSQNSLNTYAEACLDEAIQVLKLPAKQISIGGYKIYTNFDEHKQNLLEESITSHDPQNNDYALISIDSKTGQIQAYVGNSNYKILDNKRQPGSALKPILVYAPAVNEDIISPYTQILDEEICISGYSPKNFDGKYRGYVSASESLAKSLNIPAVKILTYTKLDKAKKYATECGITFDKNDNNYALALGGMTYGTTIKELAGAYTSLANSGNFVKPTFVRYITDANDKIVYISDQKQTKVFRDDTAFLMTDMLKEATKTGTSKRLKDLKVEIAAKTGTVGRGNSNSDAWSISYTTKDIIGVWIGNLDNRTINNISGGGLPTDITKSYVSKLYKDEKPSDFVIPSTVVELEIDLNELENNHQVCKANVFLPPKSRISGYFSRFNEPKQKSIALEQQPTNIDGKTKGQLATISFEAENYKNYKLFCNNQFVKSFEGVSGTQTFEHKMPTKNCEYYLLTTIKDWQTQQEFTEKSDTLTLIADTSTKQDWYFN